MSGRPGNDAIADRLEEIADRLEATGVEHKPRAYRRAAETVRARPAPVAALAERGADALTDLDRVGDAIAAKIAEYVATGSIDELDRLRDELPVDIRGLTAVEGVGPRTVGDLYEALGVTTLDELAAAAEAEEIRTVDGFGATTEANIAEAVSFAREARGRVRLGDARPLALAAVSHLRAESSAERAAPAGSIRRWADTVGDVDVLAAGDADVVAALLDWARVGDVIEAGDRRASVRVDGRRLDLRVIAPEQFGAALQYFTGSWEHNVALRQRALDRDLRLNEYGVFDVSAVDADRDVADVDWSTGDHPGRRVAGAAEAGVYDALDLQPVPPELREDAGEVAAAAAGDLPDLVTGADLRGDLHTHTTWSDGAASIAAMAAAAADRGDDYLAVTDHATGPGVPPGVGIDDDELHDLVAAAEAARADAPVELLAGVEANVDADGGISVDDDVLADLDLVVASPHAALGQDRERATDRLVRAVEHPATDVLGHPTGRLINERAGLSPDVERLSRAAADAGVALEVNANPARLDLAGESVRVAVEAGARIAIDTDAHHPDGFDNRPYGVHTARRGWAEPADVLNALPVDELRAALA